MNWLTAIVVVLWMAAAILPIAGLIGLWNAATREAKQMSRARVARDAYGVSIDQDTILKQMLVKAISGRPAAARADFFLIGGGVVAGFVADLLSLGLK